MEVSCLSQHLCYLIEGNLDAVYCIFMYQHKYMVKNPGRMTHNKMYESTDDNVFDVNGKDLDDWKYFYPGAQEIIPRHMSEALFKYAVIRAYVDFNHAENTANRILNSGIIIYANNETIIWHSKRQNTVEASIFVSEFVAIRTVTEMVEDLRYTLRCLEVLEDDSAYILCNKK